MNQPYTSTLFGLTAAILSFSSIAVEDHHRNEHLLLSIIIGIGTFRVYYRGRNILDLFNFSHQNRESSRGDLLVPAFVFASVAPLLNFSFITQSIPSLSASALLTVAYYRPLKTGTRIIRGLRTVPLLKNVMLALAWGLATTPLMPGNTEAFSIFVFRFFFVLSLSIAIDIRDCATDAAQYTQTLAILIGTRTCTLASSLLLIAAAGMAMTCLLPPDTPAAPGLLITTHTMVTAFGVLFLNVHSKPMTYFWLIDFQLFLHAMLFFFTRMSI